MPVATVTLHDTAENDGNPVRTGHFGDNQTAHWDMAQYDDAIAGNDILPRMTGEMLRYPGGNETDGVQRDSEGNVTAINRGFGIEHADWKANDEAGVHPSGIGKGLSDVLDYAAGRGLDFALVVPTTRYMPMFKNVAGYAGGAEQAKADFTALLENLFVDQAYFDFSTLTSDMTVTLELGNESDYFSDGKHWQYRHVAIPQLQAFDAFMKAHGDTLPRVSPSSWRSRLTTGGVPLVSGKPHEPKQRQRPAVAYRQAGDPCRPDWMPRRIRSRLEVLRQQGNVIIHEGDEPIETRCWKLGRSFLSSMTCRQIGWNSGAASGISASPRRSLRPTSGEVDSGSPATGQARKTDQLAGIRRSSGHRCADVRRHGRGVLRMVEGGISALNLWGSVINTCSYFIITTRTATGERAGDQPWRARLPADGRKPARDDLEGFGQFAEPATTRPNTTFTRTTPSWSCSSMPAALAMARFRSICPPMAA
ncbi:MAG: hypothetical protein JKP98_14820 [Rhodobacteraceae bacterium]|nr:hypothetical protein [Paracoccaceae bacterium]